jgi:sulfoxide reductase heme-binding subunit YedZ
VTWYLARSTGLVLLAVFTASTVLGIVTTGVPAGGRVPRFASADLHRRLSILAMLLLVGHVAISVADSYVSISWLDGVLPFAGTYRPVWLGLGTLAADLLIAVTVTSALRYRINPVAWRMVHLSAYAAWPLVLLHGLGTGSDTRRWPVLAFTAACAVAVGAAVAWRISTRSVGSGRGRLGGLVAVPLVIVVVLAVALWTWSGPLAPGWARRSGTPPPVAVGGPR